MALMGMLGKRADPGYCAKCGAAGSLDGPYAQGTVGAAAGEDNPDCASATICGQGSE